MKIKFNSNSPIYLQVSADIKRKIITGHYQSNSKLESIRELATIYGVNPNTIQKSMQELESIGLLYSERALGRFICDNQETIDDLKQQLAKDFINDFVLNLEGIGLTVQEGIKLLENREDM